MKLAFYGSSLLSAYWNGAATYYRGLLRALAAHGYEITFYEPDAFDRQHHRDIDPPPWCRVVVYQPDDEGLREVLAQAAAADIVVKASGVGIHDDILLAGILSASRPEALRIFWDVDAPATLAEIAAAPRHPVRAALAELDLVLTYGGGQPVIDAYRTLGARDCLPVYNALDPETHHPVPPEPRFRADLSFLGNRMPDREARVETFLFTAARLAPEQYCLLGGAGWESKAVPDNVRKLGHVPAREHNALNASARAVLNICRDSMAGTGFSPPTRIFEAAGAGACLITDSWDGLDAFLAPGTEVLPARDGQDVAEILRALTPDRAAAIGAAARRRILREHTYDRRADLLHARLAPAVAARRLQESAA